jgi:hypothetical protein
MATQPSNDLMGTVSRRQVAGAVALVIVVSVAIIGTAVTVMRDQLFGIGPTAVHDVASAKPDIAVCGRTYKGGTSILSGDAIKQRGGPLVLVDPALFAPCPDPASDGGKPCSNVADGPCSTVVYVRVGSDAYAAYELRGGP